MDFPIFLAHGTLGNFDELIFLGVVTVFMILMGVSWVRSRASADNDLEVESTAMTIPTSDDSDSSEHFKLQ